jgi:hypothetical protein
MNSSSSKRRPVKSPVEPCPLAHAAKSKAEQIKENMKLIRNAYCDNKHLGREKGLSAIAKALAKHEHTKTRLLYDTVPAPPTLPPASQKINPQDAKIASKDPLQVIDAAIVSNPRAAAIGPNLLAVVHLKFPKDGDDSWERAQHGYNKFKAQGAEVKELNPGACKRDDPGPPNNPDPEEKEDEPKRHPDPVLPVTPKPPLIW